ncbi:MAG TPA: hypothetical protein VE476_04625 [Propionibacteriaceae bacterium]|jgi:hypothetical protein|nr:hypothetical protein [Propionibacteriaceae bacterium]
MSTIALLGRGIRAVRWPRTLLRGVQRLSGVSWVEVSGEHAD